MSEERKRQVLRAIIKHFIETAEPVGSKALLVSYKFHVSPATIRNDMMNLEQEGYIFQPHTSAGRIPTDKGYRLFIDEMLEPDHNQAKIDAINTLQKIRNEYQIEKLREKLFDTVNILSRASNLVSFATTPDNPRTFFLGMSNVLKQPEFSHDAVRASEVIEVLEQGDNFIKILQTLDIGKATQTFIGEENILAQIQSCSIIVAQYQNESSKGFFGILGPKRMNYSFNIALVNEISKLLNHE